MCLVTVYYLYQKNSEQYLNWAFRLETLELEIQYLQAFAKPERNILIMYRNLRRISVCLSPTVSLSLQSGRYRNINSTTILVHRTMVHM